MNKYITKINQFKIGKVYKFTTDVQLHFITDNKPSETTTITDYVIPLAIIRHPAGRKLDSVTFIKVGKLEVKRNITAEFIFKNNVVEEVDWEC